MIAAHRIDEAQEELIEELRQRRRQLGWSARRLARTVGVQPSTISRIERRERDPSLHTYLKLRLALEDG